MIRWKNQPIEDMKAEELRLALEDAADEILRAQKSFNCDQIFTTVLVSFGMGALMTGLVLALPSMMR